MIAQLLNVMKEIRGKNDISLVLWDEKLVTVFEEHGELIAEFCDIHNLTVLDLNPKEISKVINVDYNTINELYPKDSAKIFGKISITSPESVLNKIVGEKLIIDIDGKNYEIPKKAVKTEWEGLPGQEIIEFKQGLIIKSTVRRKVE